MGPLEKQPVTLTTVSLFQPHEVENVQMQKVKVNAVVVSINPVLLMSCEDGTEFSRSFTAPRAGIKNGFEQSFGC